MEENKIVCPCCGTDITETVRAEVVRRIRQINAKKALASRNATPEEREKRRIASAARLQKWRDKHPKVLIALADKAQRSRTPETFARQAETMRETLRRKSILFSRLVMEAKASGQEITPELEKELLEEARQTVKAELKAERAAKKKTGK